MRLIPFITMYVLGPSASASVVEYTDKTSWHSAVGTYSTIDFTGHPNGMPITTQYSESHGITFAPGSQTHHSSSFTNDGQGLRGQPSSHFAFYTPMQWIAVEFTGNIVFDLYFKGELIYTSTERWAPINQVAFFGLISNTPFDEVHLYRATFGGLVFYDDLYFGVPAPGALGVFALAAFGCRRRRRS
ncbi:MAG TPA: hypothetical protein PK098_12030 [Phycisphaerales bacterium]|nr:hypothetical protein [Phycisphaerales bacterium]